ncbi:MAG: hypothetical protein HY328_17535 [Chloroflexi bacterium]|nr:hypothetical protein [Chloroflexota bacterium]
MPSAQKLPRKYLTALDDAVSDLKLMGQRLGRLVEELERERLPADRLLASLHNLQAQSYAAALHLNEMEVAGGCDICPSAPAQTTAQIQLAIIGQELQRLAQTAQMSAHLSNVAISHHSQEG